MTILTRLTVADVCQQLSGVQRSGKGFMARCPAHEDSKASLKVDTGNDGRVLLHCKAGCKVQEIARALSIEVGQLFPERPDGFRAGASGPNSERHVATYSYTDEHGATLYEALRYDVLDYAGKKIDKTFKQRRPIGAGEYAWGTKGVRRVLYRLPELIEAVASDKRICVVEGEKDADRLWSLGIPAATAAGGSGAPWLDDYSLTLAGAEVAIFPDNDPPGEAHGAKVLAGLHGIAKSVRTVRLPGLAVKGDVSDWLDAGHTADELLAELERTPEPEEVSDGLPDAVRLLDATDPEPIQWTVDRLIPADELTLLYGDGGSYKSTIALHLAAAVAYGGQAFGRFDTTARNVVIVSGEDSGGIIYNRIAAMCRGHGWDFAAVAGRIYTHALDGATLADPAWIAKLGREVERLDAGLVILDPLAELIEGEENSATEMRPMVKAARGLKEPTAAAVIVVHHAGKESMGKRKQDRVRGSSVFFSAARAAFFIEPREGGAGVECVKFSRAPKRDPFVIEAVIEANPTNEAEWTLARFSHASTQLAELNEAESFILSHLQGGDRFTTTDLKKAATERNATAPGKAISAVAISRALRTLEMRKVIDAEEGPRGSKGWGLATLPGISGQGGQGAVLTLPSNLGPCRATTHDTRPTLPAPIGARSGQGELDGQTTLHDEAA